MCDMSTVSSGPTVLKLPNNECLSHCRREDLLPTTAPRMRESSRLLPRRVFHRGIILPTLQPYRQILVNPTLGLDKKPTTPCHQQLPPSFTLHGQLISTSGSEALKPSTLRAFANSSTSVYQSHSLSQHAWRSCPPSPLRLVRHRRLQFRRVWFRALRMPKIWDMRVANGSQST